MSEICTNRRKIFIQMRFYKRRPILLLFIFIISVLTIRYFQVTRTSKSESYDGFTLELNEHVKLNPRQLIDLKYTYYILKPNLDYYQVKVKFLGLIIIHSYVGNDHVRAAHREAISSKELLAYGFKRIFLLADIPQKERYITQIAIRSEANRFADILQGSFIDAYRNLTYKHIMGLKYAATEARDAQYVIKMDDDIVFDPYRVYEMIKNIEQEEDEYLLKGFILSDQKVIREKYNKWFVTNEEFHDKKYPSYLSGWFYITNLKTAHDLVLTSESMNYFWIDDIYVTGILAEQLSISLDGMNDVFSANSEFLDCCIKDTQNKRLECDFLVGPNEGDTKMIVNFIKAARTCYLGGCTRRDSQYHVRNTCVAQTKDLLRERGEPVVKAIRL